MKAPWTVAWLLVMAVPTPCLYAETLFPAPPPTLYPVMPASHEADYDYYGNASGVQLDSATKPLYVDGVAQTASSSQGFAGGGCSAACTDYGCGCAGYGYGCGGGCCDGFSHRLPLLPFIHGSDRCYDCFISPITNPVFFEDPRNLTEARMIFINNSFPAGLGSGNAQVYAMQLRARLTERLSLIAVKDGYIVGDNAAPLRDGWADINAGLKYLLFADPERQRLLSVGSTYEMASGTRRALQGNGNGVFNFFATGGTQFLNNYHWISAVGIRAPTNTIQEAPVMYWSNHFDRYLLGGFYGLMEFNWFNYVRDGGTAFSGINGIDLLNLGGRNIAGNNIVTGALGLKWKPARWTELGAAFEVPLNSNRRDIMQNRIYADWILRY